MLRDKLLSALGSSKDGMSSRNLADQVDYKTDACSIAALDSMLLFFPEVVREGSRWKIAAQKSRSSRILAAIESYADSTGKKIFRLSTALASIPAHEHPTEEELSHILSASHGKYQLLKNAMIKRNG